jgi:peptidoglycan/xylan/chitin deacetylase (PgdA/CDA1 family)
MTPRIFNAAQPVGRWLRLSRSQAALLCYHRVTELDTDPQLLSVTPKHFAEQLEVLRRRFHVSRLDDWSSGRKLSHARCVIITFDDGYSDNLHEALPLLQAAECPFTIFVTAGKLNEDTEFWWDELERIILVSPSLPETLSVIVDGQNYAWRTITEANDADSGHSWNVLTKQPPSPRQVAYLELSRLFRKIHRSEQCRILDKLRTWAGLGSSARHSHRVLTSYQLCELASDRLVEIGAHTINHPSLATLPIDAQRIEISGSKKILEDLLGKPVRSFAYPFGAPDDVNLDTIHLVREAGFMCACTTYPDVMTSRHDRHSMPRFLVRDWDGDEFSRRLEYWNV